MFSKLVARNVFKSMRDYAVYFMTLAFGVCIFYVFNSLDAQQTMMEITSSMESSMVVMSVLVEVVSVFVSIILAFLVLYANKFMIKRRKKELGIYMTLGMPQSRISGLLVLETALIGVLALAVGLSIGLFLAQGMAVFTARIFDVAIRDFHFVISQGAVIKTLIYFGVIFLLVMVFNYRTVSRCKLIDLIYGGKRNEKAHLKSLLASVILFILSVAVLLAAYKMLYITQLNIVSPIFWLMLLVGVIGTLGIFFSLSGFLLRVIKSSRRIYYRGLNMFTLRQLSSKINTNFISMTIICLMLLITLGALSCGAGFNNALRTNADRTAPYDVTFTVFASNGHNGDTLTDQERDLHATLEEVAGLPMAELFSDTAQIYMRSSQVTYMEMLGDYLRPMIDENSMTGLTASTYEKNPVLVISLSDLNRLRQMRGEQPLEMGPKQFAAISNLSMMRDGLASYTDRAQTITLAGTELTLKQDCGLLYDQLEDQVIDSSDFLLVVPDAVAENLPEVSSILNCTYTSRDLRAMDARLEGYAEQLSGLSRSHDLNIQAISHQSIYETSAGLGASVSFVGLYIGIVFLIASAAVLALQQLSEASDNVPRYRLLGKLGVEPRMMSHALFFQIAVYFILPLILAVIHAAVSLPLFNQLIGLFGHVDIGASSLFTALILVGIYGGYFLATYLGCKSMIKEA
ncbi:MAG: FtsX-like permease family protein [Christensenellales bacterium]|jgi:putative ABC transport system permease protein